MNPAALPRFSPFLLAFVLRTSLLPLRSLLSIVCLGRLMSNVNAFVLVSLHPSILSLHLVPRSAFVFSLVIVIITLSPTRNIAATPYVLYPRIISFLTVCPLYFSFAQIGPDIVSPSVALDQSHPRTYAFSFVPLLSPPSFTLPHHIALAQLYLSFRFAFFLVTKADKLNNKFCML
jgi:hypothetical protein